MGKGYSMAPNRYLNLLVALVFAFGVLAPAPLMAAERARNAKEYEANIRSSEMSRLDHLGTEEQSKASWQGFKDFWKNDWEQTKADMRGVGEFLKRDWEQTKKDFVSIKLKMYQLRKNLFSKGGSRKNPFEKLRSGLMKRASDAIDEMGASGFRNKIKEVAGVDILPNALQNADDQMLRGLLIRNIEETFDSVAHEMANADRKQLEKVIDDAEVVVNKIHKGATPEEVIEDLKRDHLASVTPDGAKASGGTKKVFKAIWTVVRTLFMVAAVGAIGMVTLGFMVYGLSAQVFLFTAVGGAATVACLVGVIYYIYQGIKEIIGKKGSFTFKGDFDLEFRKPALANEEVAY